MKNDCDYNEDKCPKCGNPMSQEVNGYSEKCSQCDFIFYHCGACMDINEIYQFRSRFRKDKE